MMECPKCKQINPPGATFCDCGYAFTAESAGQKGLDAPSIHACAPTPAYTLFDHRAVWVATFFGQPLGGSILIAINYLRLGKGATVAAFTTLVGLVATGLVMLSVSFLPWGQVALILDAMILLFTMKYAKAIQGSSIEEHKSRGGRLASLWAALGIGVAALAFNALAVWAISTTNLTSRLSGALLSRGTDEAPVGTPESIAGESVEAVQKRAERGDAQAQIKLGEWHRSGKGVPQDGREAVRWYRKAADQGNAEAQFELGMTYRFTPDAPQDDFQAALWLRKAAEQRYAKAQFQLGDLYEYGTGGPPDTAEAARWYREAAEQGFAEAQCALGQMYEVGKGLARDRVQAYMWFDIAAARSSGTERSMYVEKREAVRQDMNPRQIADAERRAREWKPKANPQP